MMFRLRRGNALSHLAGCSKRRSTPQDGGRDSRPEAEAPSARSRECC
ncbi:hypothetical protein ACFPRL_28355 [Pseudoclavibacter helvolus]